MQILKTFIDSTGHRHKVGADVPKEWDKATLAHYQHHGMVGESPGTSKAPAKPRKLAGPAEKKPAAPSETQAASADATQPAADAANAAGEAGTTAAAGDSASATSALD